MLIAVLPQVRAADSQLHCNIGRPGQPTPPNPPTQRYLRKRSLIQNINYLKLKITVQQLMKIFGENSQ
jgi:hypothetical protein